MEKFIGNIESIEVQPVDNGTDATFTVTVHQADRNLDELVKRLRTKGDKIQIGFNDPDTDVTLAEKD